MIGERELAVMKPSAVFINIARGTLVDEDVWCEHYRKSGGGCGV